MMKNQLYLVFTAILAFAAVANSCQKEIDIITNPDQQNDVTEVPSSITAVITDDATKTSYDTSTGRFTWTNDVRKDRVGLLVQQSNNYKLDNFSFEVSTVTDNGRTASFISTGNWSSSLVNYNTGASWISTTYALFPLESISRTTANPYPATGGVYPVYALIPDLSEACTNFAAGYEYCRTGALENVPMIGTEVASDNYYFKASTGVLKLTIGNLPSSGTVKLSMSDDTYHLRGHFEIANDSEGVPCLQSSKYLGGATTNDQTINFTRTSSTMDFYFPMPVGSIAADKLTITVSDDNTTLLQKTIHKAISITRNEVLSTPALSCEWAYLGKGYYLDNYLFGVAGGSVHVENGGKVGYYVEVDMYQNTTDTQSYRLLKPYKAAWEQLGVTAGSSLSDLNFRVVNNGESFATVAGREVVSDRDGLVFFYGDLGNYSNAIFAHTSSHSTSLFHPNWANLTDMAYNTHSCVKSYQGNGAPALVQLAPRIDLNGGYDTKHEFYTYNDVIYIVFPGCNPALMVTGDYYINNDNRFIVTIDESDDMSKGNIMITRYRGTTANLPGGGNTGSTCDISGKCYGNYVDGKLTFAGGQQFAAIEGHDGYYWTIYAGDTGAHSVSIELTFQYKEDSEIGKVLTRPRLGVGYGTADDVSSRADTESGQHFGANWMRKQNFD